MSDDTIPLPREVALTALLDAHERALNLHFDMDRYPSMLTSTLTRLDEADRQLAALEAAVGYCPAMRRVPRHRALVPRQAA